VDAPLAWAALHGPVRAGLSESRPRHDLGKHGARRIRADPVLAPPPLRAPDLKPEHAGRAELRLGLRAQHVGVNRDRIGVFWE